MKHNSGIYQVIFSPLPFVGLIAFTAFELLVALLQAYIFTILTAVYVNESVQRNVWVYDLSPGGDVSNKRLLIKFEDFGMDGMRADVDGNLYITRHGKGTVAKVAPDGRLLREIRTQGSKPSNIAFGGPDGRTAYVTLQDRGAVETFRVESPGREWSMQRE